MKRPHFAGLSCALIPLSTLLAADPSSPDIAGRIHDVHGAVSWRQGATGEPRLLDAARDRGRLLHRGEQSEMTILRENLALKPGDKESLDLVAQKSAAFLPDLLLVIAT